METPNYVIGIDLGTTFSCVSVFRHGKPEIIVNEQGARTTPSQVAFTESGRLIGGAAKDQAVLNSANTIFDAKRLIGRKFDDPSVQRDMLYWPFEVIRTEDNRPKLSVADRGGRATFFPEEVSAMVLIKMKETAENYLGATVTDAVITVPAYFNDDQRQATKNAGAIAGLNVLRIINEPTAAALAYNLDRQDHGERNVLIFDLGGGTFDVTVLNIREGNLDVLATAGNNHLGGADFDMLMLKHVMKEFKRELPKEAQFRLRLACEQAKMALSSRPSADIILPYFTENKTFRTSIRRACFEEICMELFQNTLEPVRKALEDANLSPEQINEVVLVGGSTRIPKIQEMLRDYFKGTKLTKDINPDEVVALGAAVQAAMLSGDQSEVVRSMLLTDVIPLSLGVQAVDYDDKEMMSVLIKRNTAIPTKATRLYSTREDNQKNVLIQIFEGENRLAKKNYFLGEFVLSGIPPAKRHEPKIEVTVEVDLNGIVKVSAVETSTGQRNHITITNMRAQLSKAEIDYMIWENKKYTNEERLKDEAIVAANQLHSYCNTIKLGAESAAMWGKLSPRNKEKLVGKCDSSITWLNKNKKADKKAITKEHKKLESYCQAVVAKLRAVEAPVDWFDELKY